MPALRSAILVLAIIIVGTLTGLSQDAAKPAAKADASGTPAGGATASKPSMISESQLSGLPLNGRSYSQLATLQAGVSDTSTASASRGTSGGNLSMSGSRS